MGLEKQGEAPTCAPPQPFFLPGQLNESWSPPIRPSWATSCQLLLRMAQPLRPEKGWLGPKKAPEPQTVPGKRLCFQAWPGPSESPGGLSRGAVGTGVIPRCSPGCPGAHLLQAACGVRRGASRDQLLSRLPLYSGSIRRGAAYAPCQSPASRSRGGPLRGGRRVCGGRNRRIDSRTRASGTRAADGRASGQTDGLAETGGRAGGARPGRRGRGRSRGPGGGCGGTRGTVRGRPLPGTRGPAGPSLWVRRGGAGASGSAPRSLQSGGARGSSPSPVPAGHSPSHRLSGLLQRTCRSARSQEGPWGSDFVQG